MIAMKRKTIISTLVFFVEISVFANEHSDEALNSYISLISGDLEQHRAYLQDYYDKIFKTFGLLGSIIVFALCFFQWKTRSDVKRSVKKYWENYFKREFEKQSENIHNQIAIFESQIKEEQDRLRQAKENITLLNRMIFENTNKKSSEPTSSNRNDSYKILWVDDKPKNNYALIDLLKDNEIEPIILTSTEDAINYLRLNGCHDIDALITDMKRGKSIDEGIKLIKEIKYHVGNIPTIVYTSFTTPDELKAEAQQLGAKFTTNPNQLVNDLYSILLKDNIHR